MLEWKPRLVVVLAVAGAIASQLALLFQPLNYGW